MSVWQALLFMALGAALMGVANWFNWRKYYEGKKEGQLEGHRAARETTRRSV